MIQTELALRSKLLVGLNLSYTRLIQKKQIEDGSLVFARNGEIIEVKARNLRNTQADSASVL
ncbi:MAG TPA: hypothetical protein DIT04_12185 [Dysgonomonas sp.]|nr:hypothetical protein [Dysgonomonas sp.]